MKRARRRWFDREFTVTLPPEAFPDLLERLRGTPLRLSERAGGLPGALLIDQPDGSWSIQENVGHLVDLEPLWLGRLDDLLSGAPMLRPADLTNRGTESAGHNRRALTSLLAEFAAARSDLIRRLDRFTRHDLSRTALHPRLERPMTVMDLMFFVAEHDDHHLSRISELRGRDLGAAEPVAT